jgi:hypothetical protein
LQKEYRDNLPKPEPKIDMKEESVDSLNIKEKTIIGWDIGKEGGDKTIYCVRKGDKIIYCGKKSMSKEELKIDTKEECVDPVSMVDILEKSKIQTDKFWKDIKDWDGFEKKHYAKLPTRDCEVIVRIRLATGMLGYETAIYSVKDGFMPTHGRRAFDNSRRENIVDYVEIGDCFWLLSELNHLKFKQMQKDIEEIKKTLKLPF